MAKEGRPTVMTSETLRKLEEAFSIGASDKEAIFVADVSSTAFYDYCKEHPEFAERKEQLKDMPKYKARKNINKAIDDGDKNISTWYLERKVKEEFSQRVEQTGKEGGPIEIEDSTEIKQLTQHLNAIHAGTSIPSNGGASSAMGIETQDQD